MKLSFVSDTLHLPRAASDPVISRVVTDSRLAQAGDLFVALAGENRDGHDFAAPACERGAYALVSRSDCVHLPRALPVADTLAALHTLAAAWRQQINPTVLGITGSSGKTTVKEMLAAILRQAFGSESVLATSGNLNNHIGLPLTLLSLRPQHRYAVIEMGMNHFGELAVLTRLARPDAALVNNALRAHIGCGFNGVADIARAKSEIYQGLPPDGLAVLPEEDSNLPLLTEAAQAYVQQTFGVDSGCIHAEGIEVSPSGSRFELVCGSNRQDIVLPVPGRHNIANACAAAALAMSAGVSLPDIAAGLVGFANIKGRFQIGRGLRGITLIDDTYNANPDSMKAALDVLAIQNAPRVFVMGDMGELGEAGAEAMHAEIGAYARRLGIDAAYFTGRYSAAAAAAFGENAHWFADKDTLSAALSAQLPPAASVLVKGSRFMQMETVVASLSGCSEVV